MYGQRDSRFICDGAAWHKSGTLEVPEGISILHIPPYTPEMNPIEQNWRELQTRGFRNEVFAVLEKGGRPSLQDNQPPFSLYRHEHSA
ncbi:MAG: transposase [Clostridia bacterium]|nr:transposase [Clostridia bacterium]